MGAIAGMVTDVVSKPELLGTCDLHHGVKAHSLTCKSV